MPEDKGRLIQQERLEARVTLVTIDDLISTRQVIEKTPTLPGIQGGHLHLQQRQPEPLSEERDIADLRTLEREGSRSCENGLSATVSR